MESEFQTTGSMVETLRVEDCKYSLKFDLHHIVPLSSHVVDVKLLDLATSNSNVRCEAIMRRGVARILH